MILAQQSRRDNSRFTTDDYSCWFWFVLFADAAAPDVAEMGDASASPIRRRRVGRVARNALVRLGPNETADKWITMRAGIVIRCRGDIRGRQTIEQAERRGCSLEAVWAQRRCHVPGPTPAGCRTAADHKTLPLQPCPWLFGECYI